MVSHSDNGEQEFDDWASAHGRLLPWSDDQTTATYQLSQLSDLQQYARANTRPRGTAAGPDLQDLAWSDTSSEWDPAPIILEETVLPPAPAAHASRLRSHTSRPMPPPNRAFETRAAGASSPWPRPETAPQQVYLPGASSVYDPDEENQNPFASPHRSLGAWLLVTLAAAGLFAGVLFGRLLLRTSMPDAGQPPQAPPSLVVEPAAPAAVATPAPLAIPAPELRSEVPASVAEPASARKPSPSQARAKHARVSREGSESNLEPLERMASDSSTASASHEYEAAARSNGPVERDTSPPSAGEPGAPATLRLNSRPWSQVFVDGQLVGTTPLLGVSVTAGKHAIRLVNPEFGMAKTFTVNVAPGESLTRIEILQN